MAVRYTEEQLNTVDKFPSDPDGSEPAGTVGDPNRRSPFPQQEDAADDGADGSGKQKLILQ